MVESADVVQPISMLSPLVTVTTCYHALIHYCYLVIEVTRRLEVLLADQGDRDREPESVESFGSAPVSPSSDSSLACRYLSTKIVDQRPCHVVQLFHVACSPHRCISYVWPIFAYEMTLVDYRTTSTRATHDSGRNRQHIRRPRRRPPLPSDTTPARTSVHRYIGTSS